MSQGEHADGVSDRDRQPLTQNGTRGDAGPTEQEQIDKLRERNRELEAELADVRDELTGIKKALYADLNNLRAEIKGRDPTDPRANNYYDDLTTLEKYAEMSEDERQELLAGNPSKRRAVAIFENWNDWSMAGARDQAEEFISTNQTRGRYNKLALKVDLQSATKEDLQNIEVYRAMKKVAELSATDPDDVSTITDEFGRQHITGGAFEYHEKVNPDAGNHYKVLTLADLDALTLADQDGVSI